MTADHDPDAGDSRAHPEYGRAHIASGVPETPLKVSPGVAQVIDGVRTRFGVAIEILSNRLLPVIPEAGGDLYRAVERSTETRGALSAALERGRSRTLTVADAVYVLQPLRAGRAMQSAAGLLAVECPKTGAPVTLPSEEAATRLVEFLRSAIEADLAMADGLKEERAVARRTWGTLRFLAQLASVTSEEELATAVVHAAAVWFDVDARLYRRDLAGNLTLHTRLPGVSVAPAAIPLKRDFPGQSRGAVRLTSADDLSGLEWAGPEALLVPVYMGDRAADWMLVIGGVLPPDGQVVFETIAQTMGAQLRRIEGAYRGTIRSRFLRVFLTRDVPFGRVLAEALQQILAETGAASGSVTLFDALGPRQVASVGSALVMDAPPSEPLFGVNGFVYPMTLGMGTQAVLELAPAPGTTLSTDAQVAFREAAPLFHVFLSGVIRSDRRVQPGDAPAAFVFRIEEEVERAKRFDLALSMLLVDVNPLTTNHDVVQQVVTGVRSELRTSDLLGVVGPGRIAALLVHTDATGIAGATGRVRRRLEGLLETLGLPALRVGRAVLSGDCRTTSELLSRASRDLEPIGAT